MIRSDLLPDLQMVKAKVTGPRRHRYDTMLNGYNEESESQAPVSECRDLRAACTRCHDGFRV